MGPQAPPTPSARQRAWSALAPGAGPSYALPGQPAWGVKIGRRSGVKFASRLTRMPSDQLQSWRAAADGLSMAETYPACSPQAHSASGSCSPDLFGARLVPLITTGSGERTVVRRRPTGEMVHSSMRLFRRRLPPVPKHVPDRTVALIPSGRRPLSAEQLWRRAGFLRVAKPCRPTSPAAMAASVHKTNREVETFASGSLPRSEPF